MKFRVSNFDGALECLDDNFKFIATIQHPSLICKNGELLYESKEKIRFLTQQQWLEEQEAQQLFARSELFWQDLGDELKIIRQQKNNLCRDCGAGEQNEIKDAG